MNKSITPFLAVAACAMMTGYLSAKSLKLAQGENTIEAPSMANGLCVHNMFRSKIVIQRDKPIMVRG